MKNFLIINLIAGLVLGGAAWYFTTYYLDPELKIKLEQKLSETLKTPVIIDHVVTRFYPPKFEIHGLHFNLVSDGSNIDFKLDMGEFQLDIFQALSKKFDINLKLFKPEIQIKQTNASPVLTADQQEVYNQVTQQVREQSLEEAQFYWEQTQQQMQLTLNLEIISGQIYYVNPTGQYSLGELNFNLNIPNLNDPWQISAESTVKAPQFSMPIKIQSTVALVQSRLNLTSTLVSVFGVQTNLNGVIDLATLEQNIKFQTNIAKLESLSVPLETGCINPTTGSILLEGQFSARKHMKSPNLNLAAQLGNVLAEAKCNLSDSKLLGPIQINADVKLNYNQKLALEKLNISTNLQNTEIEYKNIFKKPKDKIFSLNIAGTLFNDVFNLTTGQAQLDKYKASVNGSIGTQSNALSDIKISITKSSLTGLELFFPIAGQYPLRGEVELYSQIQGNLQDPNSLQINITPLKASNVRASLAWENTDKTVKIKGPATANINANIQIKGTDLKNASIQSDVNLSELSIETANFVKKEKIPLNLKLTAVQQGKVIKIKTGQILLPGGTLNIAGDISGFLSPILNLTIKSQGLQIGSWLKMSPLTSEYGVSGSVSSDLKLYGSYDLKNGIEKSPLTLAGSVQTSLGSIVLPTQQITQASNPGQKTTEIPLSPSPLAPNWPLIQKMNVAMDSKIQSIKYGEFEARGVQTKAKIQSGVLNVSGTINSLFGGSTQIIKFSLPLLTPAPTTELTSKVNNIDIGKIINWKYPEWKNLMSGHATGQIQLKAAHPSEADFLMKTLASGSVMIKNGFLNTISIDQLVNDKIKKIPLISDQQKSSLSMNSKGAKGHIDSKFEFKNGKLNLGFFQLITPENNELTGDGTISVDKTMDMNSVVHLANAPIKGSVQKANSDNQGRFMVPVKLSGNIFSPNFHITDETLKKIAENTAKYEANQLKQQATTQLKKEADKVKNDLTKKANEQLKKLFK